MHLRAHQYHYVFVAKSRQTDVHASTSLQASSVTVCVCVWRLWSYDMHVSLNFKHASAMCLQIYLPLYFGKNDEHYQGQGSPTWGWPGCSWCCKCLSPHTSYMQLGMGSSVWEGVLYQERSWRFLKKKRESCTLTGTRKATKFSKNTFSVAIYNGQCICDMCAMQMLQSI